MSDPLQIKKDADEDWYPLALRATDLAQLSLPVLQEKVVDCGGCPVSIDCKMGNGEKGTGIACKKCGSTAVVIGAESVSEGALVYIVDCTEHKFRKATQENLLPECPLCTGLLARAEMRGFGDPLEIQDHAFLVRGIGEVRNIQWPKRPEDVPTLCIEDVSILPVQGVILTVHSSVDVKTRQEKTYKGFEDALSFIMKQREEVTNARYTPPEIDLSELQAAEDARKKKKAEEDANKAKEDANKANPTK